MKNMLEPSSKTETVSVDAVNKKVTISATFAPTTLVVNQQLFIDNTNAEIALFNSQIDSHNAEITRLNGEITDRKSKLTSIGVSVK
jgi:peptidoglycan hydrolase CwlO-like protein